MFESSCDFSVVENAVMCYFWRNLLHHFLEYVCSLKFVDIYICSAIIICGYTSIKIATMNRKELKNKAIELRQEGYSYTDISKKISD